jgi:hypothetical protein
VVVRPPAFAGGHFSGAAYMAKVTITVRVVNNLPDFERLDDLIAEHWNSDELEEKLESLFSEKRFYSTMTFKDGHGGLVVHVEPSIELIELISQVGM